MSKKKQKKNYKKNYRKDCQKSTSTFPELPVLRLAGMKDGAIEYLISTRPYGWTECDMEKPSDNSIELKDIQLPIPGNQFLVEVARDDLSARQALMEVLAELKRHHSLRLFHFPVVETFFFATNAAVETVTTLFEYILSKHGIGVGSRISYK